ncbi:S66 peptidase family protein [Roseivirga misakiensis]|uniref:LD-carboxypeptidase n=1 Tax=Roseivirga misakiensis TaxID=1563681 RepID=A0A1E5T640_9BACT|nr:LD-carboxypeptidase [Roseivirga misakiensis]OEK06816.1 hypothetical protein BFP71_03925 [Roseivirga misakiensis]
MKCPTALKSGDKVIVVATAKRLESSIEAGLETLEKWGLDVMIDDIVHKQEGYFAGTDRERIKGLQNALDNPEIKAVIFARGGYGTTRILDKIDFRKFQTQPKWLVGFSDLTSMLLQANRFKIPSIHGPVALTIGQDAESDEYLKALLFGQRKFEYPLEPSSLTISGDCSGKIVGGNLTLVCESIGAANEIDTANNILFLEEVGEAKYSIDRMFNKLQRVGKLEQLAGVIIGSFSNITDPQNYFEEDVDELIHNYFAHLDIPVAYGLSAGHEKENYPLIMGVKSNVRIDNSSLSIEYLD